MVQSGLIWSKWIKSTTNSPSQCGANILIFEYIQIYFSKCIHLPNNLLIFSRANILEYSFAIYFLLRNIFVYSDSHSSQKMTRCISSLSFPISKNNAMNLSFEPDRQCCSVGTVRTPSNNPKSQNMSVPPRLAAARCHFMTDGPPRPQSVLSRGHGRTVTDGGRCKTARLLWQ